MPTHRQRGESQSLEADDGHVQDCVGGQVDTPSKCGSKSHLEGEVIKRLANLAVSKAALVGAQDLVAPVLEVCHLVCLVLLPFP